MSVERKRMIETLKEYVVPVLRRRGFKGSFPHFRRLTENAIHLLTFQFDNWGGGFVIEISKCPPSGVTMHWGEHIPPSKVTAHHLHPYQRLRLGAPDEKSDGRWFRYDKKSFFSKGDPYEKAALEVLPLFDNQAELWWKQLETDDQKSCR